MNPDTLFQLLQKGFRVTLGATTFFVETLQDPQRREQNLYKLRTELSELTEEWEVKGEVTEQEARNFVDTVLSQQFDRRPQTSSGTSSPAGSPVTPGAAPGVQQDLQELTAQIAAIRLELERLREQDS
jgi:polyhydroxyalkanoate synthesis regulator phasin